VWEGLRRLSLIGNGPFPKLVFNLRKFVPLENKKGRIPREYTSACQERWLVGLKQLCGDGDKSMIYPLSPFTLIQKIILWKGTQPKSNVYYPNQKGKN